MEVGFRPGIFCPGEEHAEVTRMDPMMLRGAERLIAVLIGGMCIVLGFLLFLRISSETDATGEIKLPGGISIMLSRVGPGVFFAAFGAALVGLSFYFTVKIDMAASPGGLAGNPVASGTRQSYIGIGSEQTGRHDAGDLARSQVRGKIATLNSIRAALRPDLSEIDRLRIAKALDDAKLALMTEVWWVQWGERHKFEDWLNSGGPAPPRTSPLGKALDFYQHGEEVQR
jgi:hypothetical protein